MPRYRTSATKSPPRLMIELTPKQWDVVKRHLPYGFQKQIFSAIIEDMVQMWETFGDDFTRAMLAKNLTYHQFMQDYMEKTHYGYTRTSKDYPFPQHELGRSTNPHQRDQSPEKGSNPTESRSEED